MVFEKYVQDFKNNKEMALSSTIAFKFQINKFEHEIKYHDLNTKLFPFLGEISDKINDLLEEVNQYYTSMHVIHIVFEKRIHHKQILKRYLYIQDFYLQTNKGMRAFALSKELKRFKRNIHQQLFYLKQPIIKKCNRQLFHYVEKISASLIQVLNILSKSIRELKKADISKLKTLEREYDLEKMFIQNFIQYLISIRENVILIYPSNLESSHFTPYIIQYSVKDKLKEVFNRFSEKFYNSKNRNVFKSLFFNPEI